MISLFGIALKGLLSRNGPKSRREKMAVPVIQLPLFRHYHVKLVKASRPTMPHLALLVSSTPALPTCTGPRRIPASNLICRQVDNNLGIHTP